MIINKIKLVLLAAAFLCIGTNKAQNLEWGFNVGNFDTDSWSGGELKSNGDLVVYGFIYGGDLNPLGAPMQAQGGNLINTYNSQGELVQSLPITADIRIKDLKLDADNNMLVLASYQASNVDIDFGTGTNYIQLVDSSNYRNCYIAKYAPNGDLIWAKPFNYPYMISLNMLRIATDAAGNAYLAGTFGNGLNDNFDVDFDAAVYNIRTLGLQDLFLTKYDANDGHFLWGFNIGVPPQCWTGNCNAEEVYMEGLAVDADGNAYITAHFGDSLDIDPNPNNIVGFNALNVATALLKYNSNGNLVWGRHIGQNTAATTLKLSARANNGDLFLNYFCARDRKSVV